MDGRFRIRPGEPADIAAITEAERACFSDPWSESSIRDLFQNETSLVLVAELQNAADRFAGYLSARAMGGEAEIMSLAVLPQFRRQGLGSGLVDWGLSALVERGARSVYLEVRESNEAARQLYGRRGFAPIGLRPDYYRKPREHALVLALRLLSPAQNR